MEKYAKLWDEIKYNIKTINGGECIFIKCNGGELAEYEIDYMKMKFNSDDNLPLNKLLKLRNLTIVRAVFEEGGKYYPEVFSDECLYEL